MEEVWKDFVDISGYEISTCGNARNKKTGHILRQATSGRGYRYIVPYVNGKHITKYIHKSMGEAFIPNPENKPRVNHKDGNKLNNVISNLEWVTYSENNKHAYDTGLKVVSDKVRAAARKMALSEKTRQAAYDRHPNIRIIETGEVFESNIEVARTLGIKPSGVYQCLYGKKPSCGGVHLEYTNNLPTSKKVIKQPFLYPHQEEAVGRMFDGCILKGGVGSGKSRTGLYYYFKEFGGQMEPEYVYMKDPSDLIIITTAKKRNDKEWEGELAPYLLSTNPDVSAYKNEVIVDSWQNIQKYADRQGSFFIFDEDHVTGEGAWVKAFLKIVKKNRWIILSASPGDTWQDYTAVFIANGFYKNKTEFKREHLRYDPYCKNYPRVIGYMNETRLIRLRNKILIDMDFKRHTIPHHEDIYVRYDIPMYKEAMKTRWDPYKNEPMKQASELCYVLRRIVNSDESRQIALLELYEKHPRMIVFYSFDYERDILLNLYYGEDVEIAEYSGHAHQPIPSGDKWVYIVNYTAGCEGFNCIKTDTIVFYSQSYSYKTMLQAAGRIDRLNTPYTDLYYYHIKSRSGIDLAISKALTQKKNFNEGKWVKW